jgi:hypothetical protein
MSSVYTKCYGDSNWVLKVNIKLEDKHSQTQDLQTLGEVFNMLAILLYTFSLANVHSNFFIQSPSWSCFRLALNRTVISHSVFRSTYIQYECEMCVVTLLLKIIHSFIWNLNTYIFSHTQQLVLMFWRHVSASDVEPSSDLNKELRYWNYDCHLHFYIKYITLVYKYMTVVCITRNLTS